MNHQYQQAMPTTERNEVREKLQLTKCYGQSKKRNAPSKGKSINLAKTLTIEIVGYIFTRLIT